MKENFKVSILDKAVQAIGQCSMGSNCRHGKQDQLNKWVRYAFKEMKQVKVENPVKSVGMKLFLMFFVSILVFVLTVGMISYSVSKSVIKNKVSESSLTNRHTSRSKIRFPYIKLLMMYHFKLCLNKELQDLLDKVPKLEASSYEALRCYASIDREIECCYFLEQIN